MKWNFPAIVLSVATTLASPCLAQPTAQTADPKACSDQQRLQLGSGTAPHDPTNQSLSQKLDHTDGVLCPPAKIDPDITVPAPATGRMPVIPPPGSPGGNPNVQPK